MKNKTTNECLNENKILWEKKEDGMVVEEVFLTKDGELGMCHYGECVIKPVREWVNGYNEHLAEKKQLKIKKEINVKKKKV